MPFAPAPDLTARFRRDVESLSGGDGPFGVAVSGGPDSLALLLLAHAAFPGRVEAATVDHGLRAESAGEAALVARICAGLGVLHAVLRVDVAPAGRGVQAAARAARHSALGRCMAERALATLLTAHHADDQAETLLMRLLRGSGVAGLAGIRAGVPLPAAGAEARLCRPLLAWRRAELEALVEAAGIEPVRDPSNCDEAYDRARVRRLMAEAPWLDPAPLARSAAVLAEAEEALEAMAERLFAERSAAAGGRVTLDPGDLPPEILRRLVLRCLRAVEPAAEPRGEPLAALAARLAEGGTATLAGVKCTGGARFAFEKAPPRRG